MGAQGERIEDGQRHRRRGRSPRRAASRSVRAEEKRQHDGLTASIHPRFAGTGRAAHGRDDEWRRPRRPGWPRRSPLGHRRARRMRIDRRRSAFEHDVEARVRDDRGAGGNCASPGAEEAPGQHQGAGHEAVNPGRPRPRSTEIASNSGSPGMTRIARERPHAISPTLVRSRTARCGKPTGRVRSRDAHSARRQGGRTPRGGGTRARRPDPVATTVALGQWRDRPWPPPWARMR